MKKILLILLATLVLASCHLQILDSDRFAIYQMGWGIGENQILIQSHESFIINDKIYTEIIVDDEAIIENPLNHDIKVRLTYQYIEEWITIEARDKYIITLDIEE